MANGSNVFDFTIPWATFTATSISDGTYSDVFVSTKVDRVGYEVAATSVTVAHGQIWSNGVDDFISRVYQLNPGREDYTGIQTVGAVNATQDLATIDADGEVWRMAAVVTGSTSTAGEVASAHISAHFYRSGGTVSILDPVHTIVTTAGLAGADADFTISADVVRITFTGIGGKTIDWDARVDYVEQIR